MRRQQRTVPPGQPAAYQLRLPDFEGPLDLLLHLIERRELAVTTLSLAAVADQYLGQVAALRHAEPAVLAEFVAVGARLVLIKSRALLPAPAAMVAEADEVDDGEALALQLAAYRQARAAARALAARQVAGTRAFARLAAPVAVPPPPLAPRPLDDLVRVVRRRLLELPPAPTPMTLARVVTVAEKVAQIEEHLVVGGRLRLSALLARATTRAEVVVTFISLLELVRRRRVAVEQAALFDDIDITLWREGGPAGDHE
jgi:segregation and condensation protein A